MEVLILGGSGRTGKHVVSAALSKGYIVNCLVRKPEELGIEHEKLNVFEGSPMNKESLEKAWGNSTALINVLNISRTSDFPWAKSRTPSTFLSDVMQNIIAVTKVRSINSVCKKADDFCKMIFC